MLATRGCFPFSRNDCGQIAGEYQYGTSFFNQRYGYVYSNGVFSPVIFPGASFSRAVAVSCNGDIVGDYVIGNSYQQGHDLGFLLHAGVYSTIRFPNSELTIAAGINSNGDIVGWYLDKVGMHGFLLRAGAYSSIDFPGSAAFTQAWKINDAGEIAGRHIGTNDGKYHMFTLSNGNFTAVPDVPNSYETARIEDGGLNNLGDLASNYCSAKPCSLGAALGTPGLMHGFLLSHGVYTLQSAASRPSLTKRVSVLAQSAWAEKFVRREGVNSTRRLPSALTLAATGSAISHIRPQGPRLGRWAPHRQHSSLNGIW